MIVTFDFGIFPTALFVSSEFDFKTLKETFDFEIDDNEYVELSKKKIDSWNNANGVTTNVLEKKTLKHGFLVIISNEDFTIQELAKTSSHEASHVIDRLYKFIGVQDGVDTEINAYLIGWVSKCITSAFLQR